MLLNSQGELTKTGCWFLGVYILIAILTFGQSSAYYVKIKQEESSVFPLALTSCLFWPLDWSWWAFREDDIQPTPVLERDTP